MVRGKPEQRIERIPLRIAETYHLDPYGGRHVSVLSDTVSLRLGEPPLCR
jgi:hypothetical protein